MVIHIRLFLLKLFVKDRIEADRKIVRLLTQEVFYNGNHKKLGDYYLQTMDHYKAIKSPSEFEFLLTIMKDGLDYGRQKILNRVTKFKEEIKSKHPDGDVPSEQKVYMKIVDSLIEDNNHLFTDL